MGLFYTNTPPPANASPAAKAAWKSRKHPRKKKTTMPYRKNGMALALLTDSECKSLNCQFKGKKIFYVKGKKHRLAYTSPYERRKGLKKRKYTRKITDSGAVIVAKDASGHWRHVPGY